MEKFNSVLLAGISRYLKQEELDKISKYSVGIIGAGGLGSNAAMMLVRCGFRNFILADMDKIEASNLNRQYFLPEDIGKLKVEVLQGKMKALDPELKIITIQAKINSENLKAYYQMADIIIEAVDNPLSKMEILEGFIKDLKKDDKLLITASGIAGYGNITSMDSGEISTNIYKIGDGKSSIEHLPPLAPKVMVAAAMEADAVLTYALGEKSFWRKKNMDNFFATPCYALTDSKSSLGRTTLEVAEAMLKAGVKFLQYREKNKNMSEKYKEGMALRGLTKAYGATFIVNDHVDLALAVDADGVHIGQEDLPPTVIRKLLGKDKILGLSTHNPEQYEAVIKLNQEAESRGLLPIVDYIGVGPIYATKTKVDVVDPVGFAYPSYVIKRNLIPFVAIGGIKLHNLKDVLSLGVKNVALVTEITGAEDIEGTIKALIAIKNTEKRDTH